MHSRQVLARNRNANEYLEEHHIIPRSLGGNDSANNLVLLTAREHYIAHLLLIKITQGKQKISMVRALVRMQKYGPCSKNYELARKIIAKNSRGALNHAYKKKWMYNKITGEIKLLSENIRKELNDDWLVGLPYQRGGHKKSEKIWITKNNTSKMINPSELKTFEDAGWLFGRGNTTETRNCFKNVSKWMTDNISREEKIKYDKIPIYQNNGWEIGRLKRPRRKIEKKIWIHNAIKSITIPISNIDDYINNGWKKGRLK